MGAPAVWPSAPKRQFHRDSGSLAKSVGDEPGSNGFLSGRLRVGEAMSPPLMRLVKARLETIIAATGGDAIIDAPPGVSCPAVNAVLDSDVIVLVTEPTPFGVYDFQLAWEAFAPLGKPIGAVVNRAGLGGHEVIYQFCRRQRGCRFWPRFLMTGPSPRPMPGAGLLPKFLRSCRKLFLTCLSKIRDLAKPESPRRGCPCVKSLSSAARAAPARPRSPGPLPIWPATRSSVIWTSTPPTCTCSCTRPGEREEEFFSGHEAVIDRDLCTRCGLCASMCQYGAIREDGEDFVVDSLRCEGCKVCVTFCPEEAVQFPEKHCGAWYVSDTRFGPLVHAQLFPGEENSGKLVMVLKREARELAKARGADLVLCDGAPGIGCPVISSLSGAHLAVAVTEPTPSGRHDLERVADLCRHFQTALAVIINKYDLNPDETARIEAFCRDRSYPVLARLPHDPAITQAMIQGFGHHRTA